MIENQLASGRKPQCGDVVRQNKIFRLWRKKAKKKRKFPNNKLREETNDPWQDKFATTLMHISRSLRYHKSFGSCLLSLSSLLFSARSQRANILPPRPVAPPCRKRPAFSCSCFLNKKTEEPRFPDTSLWVTLLLLA